MIAALAVDPRRQSTPVYLLPRSPETEAGGRDWSVPIEAPSQMWSVHVGNAFEEANRRGGLDVRLHMSSCSYQWFHFHRMFGKFQRHKKKTVIHICSFLHLHIAGTQRSSSDLHHRLQ